MRLKITHINIYRYTCPVELTLHKLMLRPTQSHDLQIVSEKLEVSVASRLSWEQDVFNNSVAQVIFTEQTDELCITSEYILEQLNINPFNFVLEAYTNFLPFNYRGDDLIDLAPFVLSQHPEDKPTIGKWLSVFLVVKGQTKTLDFLLDLNEFIAANFGYGRREEAGVQKPSQTIALGTGCCRDFALLFMEAVRYMGLAARYVSGYLCSLDQTDVEVAANATHAWAEVYLPGAGWKGFDPTSGILAAGLHVRVAATRHPNQATPIRGSYLGDASLFKEMHVSIDARVIGSSIINGNKSEK